MSGDGKRVTALIEALAYPERGQLQLLPAAYDTAPVLDSTANGTKKKKKKKRRLAIGLQGIRKQRPAVDLGIV